MPKKKLTPSLKEKIKKDYAGLKQSDFEGDALRYLKQVRGARKGRISQERIRKANVEKIRSKIPVASEKPKKESKSKSIVVDGKTYKPGDKVYEIITLSARNKGQSVKAFIKEHEKDLKKLLSDYLVFAKSEVDTLRDIIKQLPRNAKVYSPIKTKIISARTASFNLHMLKKTLMEVCSIYPVVFIEYGFDLDSNLHFNCPRPGGYKDLEDCGELTEYLESNYENITWIQHDNPS